MRRGYWLLLAVVLLLVMLYIGGRGAAALHAAAGMPSVSAPVVVAGHDEDRDDGVKTVDVGFATLQCTFMGDGDAGQLLAQEVGGTAAMTGRTLDTTLRIDLPPGEWELRWRQGVHDRRLGKLRLDAGDQRRCKLGEPIDLDGTVKTPQGRPVAGATVRGCGGSATTDASGGWVIENKNATGCQVRAEWSDAMLKRYSQTYTFDPFAEHDLIELVLDDGPIGGVGLALGPAPDGVMVEDVIAGTVADKVGMLPGDVIQSVDGKPVKGMQLESVVNVIVGEPGTHVELSITRDGQPMKMLLERGKVEQPADTGIARPQAQ